jgi:hypothetical protein
MERINGRSRIDQHRSANIPRRSYGTAPIRFGHTVH